MNFPSLRLADRVETQAPIVMDVRINHIPQWRVTRSTIGRSEERFERESPRNNGRGGRDQGQLNFEWSGETVGEKEKSKQGRVNGADRTSVRIPPEDETERGRVAAAG